MDRIPDIDKQIIEHFEQSDRPLVHVLLDLLELETFPSNIPQLRKLLTHKLPLQMGWTIIITSNRLIKFLGYMLTQIAKARFRSVETLEEAETFLHKLDESLRETVS